MKKGAMGRRRRETRIGEGERERKEKTANSRMKHRLSTDNGVVSPQTKDRKRVKELPKENMTHSSVARTCPHQGIRV